MSVGNDGLSAFVPYFLEQNFGAALEGDPVQVECRLHASLSQPGTSLQKRFLPAEAMSYLSSFRLGSRSVRHSCPFVASIASKSKYEKAKKMSPSIGALVAP